MTPKRPARQTKCHGRTNPTDRTNAGTERRGGYVARASRFASAKGAGAVAPAEAAGGTDREAEARAGRAQSAPGRIGARPGRNDGQALPFSRDPGTGRLRLAEKTRADSRNSRELHATFATPGGHRTQELEFSRFAERVEPRAQHGGRRADGIQPAAQPPRSRRGVERTRIARSVRARGRPGGQVVR